MFHLQGLSLGSIRRTPLILTYTKTPPCVRSIATYSGDWFIDLNQEDCS